MIINSNLYAGKLWVQAGKFHQSTNNLLKLLKNPSYYVIFSRYPLQHNSTLVFLFRNPIPDYELSFHTYLHLILSPRMVQGSMDLVMKTKVVLIHLEIMSKGWVLIILGLAGFTILELLLYSGLLVF